MKSRVVLSARCAMQEHDACLGCRCDCHGDHGASWTLAAAVVLLALVVAAVVLVRR